MDTKNGRSERNLSTGRLQVLTSPNLTHHPSLLPPRAANVLPQAETGGIISQDTIFKEVLTLPGCGSSAQNLFLFG